MDDNKKKFNEFVDGAKDIAHESFEKTSEFAEDFSNEAGKVTKDIIAKAQNVVEGTKKIVKIEKLDYKISRKYKEIGKLVYATYEATGSYDKVADKLCEEVNALYDQIVALKLGDDAEIMYDNEGGCCCGCGCSEDEGSKE